MNRDFQQKAALKTNGRIGGVDCRAKNLAKEERAYRCSFAVGSWADR